MIRRTSNRDDDVLRIVAVLLICLLIIGFSAAVWFRGTRPSRALLLLTVVDISEVLDVAPKSGGGPFLVYGIPPTPLLEDWDRAWASAQCAP